MAVAVEVLALQSEVILVTVVVQMVVEEETAGPLWLLHQTSESLQVTTITASKAAVEVAAEAAKVELAVAEVTAEVEDVVVGSVVVLIVFVIIMEVQAEEAVQGELVEEEMDIIGTLLTVGG